MEKLGIEPVQLVMQIFNFLVMVFVLTKLLYKPILKKLDERKRKIEEGLAYTEKMKQEAEKTELKRTEVINRAREEARKIVEEGKKSGRRVEEQIIEKAQKEAKTILEKGQKEVENEREEIEKKLRFQTVAIATTLVETLLGEMLKDKEQQAIINKKIQQLAKLSK